jgi:hypothetical protein
MTACWSSGRSAKTSRTRWRASRGAAGDGSSRRSSAVES